MKKRKITVEFNIPAWVPTQRELLQRYKTAKYLLFPFRCEETGKRVNFKYPQYEYRHARRVMVSTHNHIRSREQWIKYVRDYFAYKGSRAGTPHYWGQEMDVVTRKCDSCGQTAPTIGTAPDLRIGMQWWNGFHVCENCLVETIRLGSESTSMFQYKNGVSWPINEAGALVKPQKQSTEPTTIVVTEQARKTEW
jgi:hypothetical protein